MTLREIVELSTTAIDLKARREQALAKRDIINDAVRVYIMWPSHENRSPLHYINASELATMYGATSIFSLFSESELEKSRAAYESQQLMIENCLSCLSEMHQNQGMTPK
jgi:hypothetical protein